MVMLLMAGGAFAFKSRLITECRQCATVAAVRVGGPSLAIGNQAEMMELEAAVIDGTRFLCYDDGATGSA
jgi:hypothetical protein